MTSNQIAYQRNQIELELGKEKNAISAGELEERIRHNYSDEQIRQALADIEAGRLSNETKLMISQIVKDGVTDVTSIWNALNNSINAFAHIISSAANAASSLNSAAASSGAMIA